MQLAREEDDGGGVALKDCFAKDLSFVLFFFLVLDLWLSKGFSNYSVLWIVLLVCLMDFFDIFGATQQRDDLIKTIWLKQFGKFHGSICKNIWGGGQVYTI